MPPLLLLIGLVGLLALLAGCDGDGESTSADADGPTASGPLSKIEYEQAFRALKTDLNQTPAPLEQLREDSTSEEAAAGFREIAGFTRDAAAQLDALEPPASIAAEHQGFVEVVEGLADGSEQIAALIEENGIEDAARTLQDPQALSSILTAPELEEKRKEFVRAVVDGDYDLGLEGKGLDLPGGGGSGQSDGSKDGGGGSKADGGGSGKP